MRRLTGWRVPSRNRCLVSWTCTRPLAPWEREVEEMMKVHVKRGRKEGRQGEREGGKEKEKEK